MDNYNSSALAEFLKSCNTNCVGTIKINRKVMPKKTDNKLQKGKVTGQHSEPVCVVRWINEPCDNDLKSPCN